MKVDYAKEFEKSLKKLSGKMLDSIRRVITEVKQAENIKDITDCTKLVGYSNIVRIRFHFLSFMGQVSQVQKLMKLKELSLPTVSEELRQLSFWRSY